MVRVHIDAPPEAVWRVLEDLEHQGEWMVDVRRLEVVSEQKRGVGAVMRVTSELFGLAVVHDVMRVTVWHPPRRMDIEHVGRVRGTGSFLLEPSGEGTAFTWVERVRVPLGVVGEALFAVAVRPHLRRVFGRSLANVGRLAVARDRVADVRSPAEQGHASL